MITYEEYKMNEVRSAVYDVLELVSNETDASEDEMKNAIEWFMVHFYDGTDGGNKDEI